MSAANAAHTLVVAVRATLEAHLHRRVARPAARAVVVRRSSAARASPPQRVRRARAASPPNSRPTAARARPSRPARQFRRARMDACLAVTALDGGAVASVAASSERSRRPAGEDVAAASVAAASAAASGARRGTLFESSIENQFQAGASRAPPRTRVAAKWPSCAASFASRPRSRRPTASSSRRTRAGRCPSATGAPPASRSDLVRDRLPGRQLPIHRTSSLSHPPPLSCRPLRGDAAALHRGELHRELRGHPRDRAPRLPRLG